MGVCSVVMTGGAQRLVGAQAIAAFSFGCGQILGADYEVTAGSEEREDGGEVASAPQPLILPGKPDQEHVEDCETCALEMCSDERNQCLADDGCVQMLRCYERCGDPDCILQCDDTYPQSYDFNEYRGCVYSEFVSGWPVGTGKCVAACDAGRNFDCAGTYDWTSPDGPEDIDLHLTVRMGWIPGLDRIPATLRVCRTLECDGAGLLAGEVQTNGAGEALLQFRTRGIVEPTVFIEIDQTPERDRYLHFDAPYSRTGRRTASFSGRRLVLTQTPPALVRSNDEPLIWVEVRDCLGLPGSGVEVVLEDAEGAIRGIPNLTDTTKTLTGEAGRVVFVNVPDQEQFTLTAHLDGAQIGSRSLMVRRDWWTEVKLYPYRRGDAR